MIRIRIENMRIRVGPKLFGVWVDMAGKRVLYYDFASGLRRVIFGDASWSGCALKALLSGGGDDAPGLLGWL